MKPKRYGKNIIHNLSAGPYKRIIFRGLLLLEDITLRIIFKRISLSFSHFSRKWLKSVFQVLKQLEIHFLHFYAIFKQI